MSEQENTNLVQQVYGNFKSGDIKALLILLSQNVEWQLPEIENVPFAGKRRGQEQMGQFFASLVDTQEVQHFDPREFIAQGDKVVALGHLWTTDLSPIRGSLPHAATRFTKPFTHASAVKTG
jgi:ketosteroid isomerase-like protein